MGHLLSAACYVLNGVGWHTCTSECSEFPQLWGSPGESSDQLSVCFCASRYFS